MNDDVKAAREALWRWRLRSLAGKWADGGSKREREERLAEGRVELAKRLLRAIAERNSGVEIVPVDDEVHREGMAFLHELAAVPALEGVVEFPPDIWESEWRRGPDDDDK